LARFDEAVSSSVLEAEFLAACRREGIAPDGATLEKIGWVFPDRRLSDETAAVLAQGPLRGADAWHVACALYFAGGRRDVAFLTLDQRQRAVAQRLGFEV
jgi:hypothetical protein